MAHHFIPVLRTIPKWGDNSKLEIIQWNHTLKSLKAFEQQINYVFSVNRLYIWPTTYFHVLVRHVLAQEKAWSRKTRVVILQVVFPLKTTQ